MVRKPSKHELALMHALGLGVIRSANGWLEHQEEVHDISPRYVASRAIRYALWCLGHHGGIEPGEFTKKLLEAFALADHENQTTLRAAYPDLTWAVTAGQMLNDGIRRLQGVLDIPVEERAEVIEGGPQPR